MIHRNRVKNLLLLVLFLAMLVLTTLAWVSDLDMSSVPEDSLLASFYQRVTYGVSGFQIRTDQQPAAMPTRIAVGAGQEKIGAQYHASTVQILYDVLWEQMGKALAISGAWEYCFEQQAAQSLQGDVVYFGYEGYFPVSLYCAWLGQTSEQTEIGDAFWLCADGTMYLHTQNGYMSKQTGLRISKDALDISQIPANLCYFAAQSEVALRADTLLFIQDVVQEESYQIKSPDFLQAKDGTSLNGLLSVFDYDLHANRYEENEGNTLVFVEDYSTLHVSSDGSVRFHASATEGGLCIGGDPRQTSELSVQVNFAYALLRQVQNTVADTSLAMLYDVTQGENGQKVMTFIQTVDGIPVQSVPEKPFARFVFQGDCIVSAQFFLQIFTPTGEMTPLIPAGQVAAAANDYSLRLMTIYQQNDNRLAAVCGYQR